MTTNNNSSSSFWQGFVAVLRFFVRLVFVIVLAIGLGVGIYYGVAYALPALHQRYIQPVEENTARLDNLEIQQEQKDQFLESLQDRLAELETQNDSYRATITMLEGQAATKGELQATQSASLTIALTTLEPLPDHLADLETNLDTLQAELDEMAETVATSARALQALSVEDERRSDLVDEMQRDLQIVETMGHLTRARLYLSQGNFEQAQVTIQAGLDVLASLASVEGPDQETVYAQSITQLKQALEALPDNPVTATDRIDGAWQLLAQVADGAPTAEASTTPTATPQATVTPTATPSE